MKIIERYSHLNGLEYLLVHNLKLWNEIQNVIKAVDAEKGRGVPAVPLVIIGIEP